MARVGQFEVGDRVRHIGMDERGTVKSVDDGIVHVEYDRTTKTGHGLCTDRPTIHWTGKYDSNWFRIHPNLLVKTGA